MVNHLVFLNMAFLFSWFQQNKCIHHNFWCKHLHWLYLLPVSMHFKEPCAIISHCLNLKSPRLLTLFSNDTAESQLNTKLTQTEKFIIFGCFCSLYLPHHFSSCQVKHNCNIFFATLWCSCFGSVQGFSNYRKDGWRKIYLRQEPYLIYFGLIG